jgi:hypothetical protein
LDRVSRIQGLANSSGEYRMNPTSMAEKLEVSEGWAGQGSQGNLTSTIKDCGNI